MKFILILSSAQCRAIHHHHHGRSTTCPHEVICSSAETTYPKGVQDIVLWVSGGSSISAPPRCVPHDGRGREEKVRYWLPEAVELLDQQKVLNLFRRYVSFDKCLHHMGYIFEDAWTGHLWEDEQWCDAVVKTIIRLKWEEPFFPVLQ